MTTLQNQTGLFGVSSPAKAGALLEQWHSSQHWHGLYVYMVASSNHKALYTGRTVDLDHRIMEHKLGLFPNAFTKKYKCTQLVWFEAQPDHSTMCLREHQIKQWQRAWKNRLINELNPDWLDLGLFLDEEIVRLYQQDSGIDRTFLPNRAGLFEVSSPAKAGALHVQKANGESCTDMALHEQYPRLRRERQEV
jgi:putative endonuclease